MKLTKKQREELKQKFGGHCAYCGCELLDKWHADHVESVLRISDFKDGKFIPTGRMNNPENDNIDNLYPACVKCNIKKSGGSIEVFRKDLETLVDRMNSQFRFSFYQHAKRFGLVQETQKPIIFFFEEYLSKNKGVV